MTQSDPTKEQSATTTAEPGEFASLLKKNFKPQSDRAREEVESAVRTLAEQALSTTIKISSEAVASISGSHAPPMVRE